jgi:hypothetical protein
MSTTTSAIERLQGLPQIFRGADLTVRFAWSSKTASQYLYLWKKRGLVSSLGPMCISRSKKARGRGKHSHAETRRSRRELSRAQRHHAS